MSLFRYYSFFSEVGHRNDGKNLIKFWGKWVQKLLSDYILVAIENILCSQDLNNQTTC